jgi:hypothetical protein
MEKLRAVALGAHLCKNRCVPPKRSGTPLLRGQPVSGEARGELWDTRSAEVPARRCGSAHGNVS